MNKLHNYCNYWDIDVNTDKTVVMVCKNNNRNQPVDLFYNNIKLKQVNSFNYLGVTLTSNGRYFKTQKALSLQASRAIHSLFSLFDNIALNISEKLKLFDSMVIPILLYGSEIWGLHKANDIERQHIKFLKIILGVRQSTPNASVYGETGRVPISVLIKVRMVKYWYKIIYDNESLMFKLFDLRNSNGDFINKWSMNIREILDELGFSYLWNTGNVTKHQCNNIVQRIYDQYKQTWSSEINNLSKLETYRTFKINYELEFYLSNVNNDSHRIALTRFRCTVDC